MTSPVHAHLATDPSSAGLGLFVTCPECGAYFELTDALVAPIRARLAEESQAALQAARVAIRKEESERARAKLNIEQQDLRNQVQEKDALLTKSNEAELKLRRKVREMEEAANDAELAQARRDDEVRRQVEAEAKERYGVKLKAKDEQLRRVEREAEDLRRKASTGSAQEEGLARQELFGEWLKSRYPSDEVVVTRRGQSGADVQWTVRSLSGTRLGDILFETKWTANWGNDWVGKLKADQQRLGVGIAGIVSASLQRVPTPCARWTGCGCAISTTPYSCLWPFGRSSSRQPPTRSPMPTARRSRRRFMTTSPPEDSAVGSPRWSSPCPTSEPTGRSWKRQCCGCARQARPA